MQTYQTIWQVNRRLNENGIKTESDKRKAIGRAGKGVIIQNKSFDELIPLYDRPKAFTYCDPPYYGTEKLYTAKFSRESHCLLRDVLGSVKGYFMLSYNDCDFIRDLYRGYYIESFERLNSISQRYDPGNMFKELLITNYDTNERKRRQPKQLTLL